MALSAVGTATASAAKPLELVGEGGASAKGTTFTGKFTGKEILWYAEDKAEIGCGTGSTAAGEVTASKTLESTIVFKGCQVHGETTTCNTAGRLAGEVVAPFSVSVVWLNKTNEEFALLFSLPKAVNMECGSPGSKLSMIGSFLMKVPARIEEPKTSFAFISKVEELKHYTQNPSEYENEEGKKVKAQLEIDRNSKAFEPIAMQFEETTTFAKSVEFRD